MILHCRSEMGSRTWLNHFTTLLTLLYFTDRGHGYVPVNERHVRFPDQTRPFDHRPVPYPGPSTVTTSRTTSFNVIAMANINRRLASVDARAASNQRNLETLSETVSDLQEQVEDLQTRMREAHPPQAFSELRSANVDLETRVSRLETENEELRGFLVAFERFFGRLMSEDPSTYDPIAAPAERMSRLRQYLGNAEAELLDVSRQTLTTSGDGEEVTAQGHVDDHPTNGEMGKVLNEWETVYVSLAGRQNDTAPNMNTARIKGTSMGPERGRTMTASSRVPLDNIDSGVHLSTAEADKLAAALEQLETRNQDLSSRLQSLEQRAADAGQAGEQTFGVSNVNTNAVTEEILNKVEVLEQVVALQASSILDSAPTADRIVPLSGPKGLAGDRGFSISSSGRPEVSSMKQEDVAIMQDVLQDARKSGSSSRKSAFSVARTLPLWGSDDHQVIEFDHVFVNKGRDFVTRNSTFICERAGYYFITFHLRSFDGLYLGVSLMKNDEIVSSVFTDAHERNVMEGQSVIVHLEPGDRLYLLLGSSPEFGLHSNDRKYVTFSGFMIYSGY